MFKLKTIAAACGIALTASALPVVAEEAEEVHSFSANVALVSNYVFRGQSQTDNGPAIQGGFDYTYNPFSLYLGTWGSNVESSGFDGASMELDVYGGWRPTFDKLTLDLGALGYLYPGNDGNGDDIDTVEFKVGISYDFDFVTPGFTFYYSPDWYATDDSAQRYELSASVPLPMDFKLVAKYGWNEFSYDSDNDYQDWSVALTTEVLGVTVGVAYSDTVSLDEKTYCAAPFQCGSQFIASISKSF
jgi:uncharacterized protein (TIGR02001 family)